MLKVAINGFGRIGRQVIGMKYILAAPHTIWTGWHYVKYKFKQIKTKHKKLFLFVPTYILILFIINIVSLIFLIPNPSDGINLLGNFFTSFSISFLSCSLFLDCQSHLVVILFNLYLAVLSFYLIFFNKLKFKHWILAFIFISFVVISFLSIRDY